MPSHTASSPSPLDQDNDSYDPTSDDAFPSGTQPLSQEEEPSQEAELVRTASGILDADFEEDWDPVPIPMQVGDQIVYIIVSSGNGFPTVVGIPNSEETQTANPVWTEAEEPPRCCPCASDHPGWLIQPHKCIRTKWDIEEDDEICKDYEFKDVQLVGRGSGCLIHSTTNKITKEKVAVKRMCYGPNTWEFMKGRWNSGEAGILQHLKERRIPGVAKMITFFTNNKECILDIVFKLETGGDLYKRISNRDTFGEHTSKHIAIQICRTLKHLHNLGYTHRDLKPHNILLGDDSDMPIARVADFGFAKKQLESIGTQCGTGGYMAPEVGQGGYTSAVDLWSYGITVAFLLLGKDCEDIIKQVRDKRLMGQEIPDTIIFTMDANGVSEEGQGFVKRLVDMNPSARMTFSQALEHPWLAGTSQPSSSQPSSSQPSSSQPSSSQPSTSQAFSSQPPSSQASSLQRSGPRAVLSERRNSYKNLPEASADAKSSKGTEKRDESASSSRNSTKRGFQSVSDEADVPGRQSKKLRRGDSENVA